MGAPESPLGPHVASLLHALREAAPDRAEALVDTIVTGGNPTLCASLAQVFHRWVEKPLPGDREALRHLLGHRDGFVRRAALGALRTLAKSSPRDAVELDESGGYVVHGTDTEATGLRSGDKLVSIEGQSVAGLVLDEVSARLMGPPGSVVRLTVKGSDGVRELALSRP